MEPGTEAVRNAIGASLGPAERVDRMIPAVGCALVLTNERLLVVRHGAAFRPKSGVRDWPLDRDTRIRMAPGAQHRLIIERDGESASVFLTRAQVDDVVDLISVFRERSGA